jgi:leader peptidase (prepilin peptidase)/N-methyltransferase
MSYLLALVLGLALGSFLNVVITRLPRGEAFWRGRSCCPRCLAPIPWYDNLPLLSFIWLKGRCRGCREPIPWRYPLVELAGGLLALALWRRFPGSPLLLLYGPFAAALLALGAIDLEHWILPDAITLPGTALGLGLALVLPHLRFWEAALGAVAGSILFYGVAWVYEKWTGKQGLGGGDVKLMAFIGAVLGIKAVPVVIFLSAGLGSLAGLALAVMSRRLRGGQWRALALPYGPFLAAGAIFYLLAGVRLFAH